MDIESLILKRNAQIYTLKRKLSKKALREIIDGASKKATTHPLISEFRKEGIPLPNNTNTAQNNINYTYSAHVFTTRKKVDFLNEEKYDEIHAYIIIIEYENYVAILKRNCSNIETILDKYLTLIPHDRILALASTTETEFQKIALRNMTTSDRAIRGRQYEAANLNGLLSLHAAGRSIPHTMRIRQGGSIKSLTTSTGRIIEQSERQAIQDIAQWVTLITTRLNANSSASEFLSSFAKPKKLQEVLKISRPASLLFETGLLHEDLKNDDTSLGRLDKSGKFIKFSKKTHQAIIEALEPCYEIDSGGNIENPESFVARLKKNSKTLTFDIPLLQKIKISDSVNTYSLQQYIIKNKFYSICFTDPKFMYFRGECFEDTSGISEIDSIIKILHDKIELNLATSEKGEFTSSSTDFESTSVFSIVEEIHKNDDYIFCDDLGDEWADHIAINLKTKTISFIHSKYGKLSNSASKFHDVVGQGIKNIGNMTFNTAQILQKDKNKFSRKYNAEHVNTNIPRTRRGLPTKFKSDIILFLENTALTRQCILACSFASKQYIKDEFEKVKSRKKVSGNIIQLLWILSSFIHATKEANIIPIVYCQQTLSKPKKLPKLKKP
ncbi:hypothetical protein [Pseudomonas syringae]|uniref:hypothetical protein n=1 Tax=Pseudomonas syringae TaxID=317 RepID=UPI00061AD88B|nr:hypothetical protein [Pseudomonas syringae]